MKYYGCHIHTNIKIFPREQLRFYIINTELELMVFKQTSTILVYNVHVIIKAITKISPYCEWLLKDVD